jgi:excisionase family DNA binding protein
VAGKQEPEVYKVQEVAERLRVHKNYVYGMIQDGTLRHLRLGTAIRVPREALEELLEGRRARTA